MPLWNNLRRPLTLAAALLGLAAPASLLTGCNMTPEDKAFYGRGWINPSELDEDTPPPPVFQSAGGQEHVVGPE
ncbi:MAG TPA: hypothetical protein VHY22_04305 [Chthoniobacteraceae bacterium]|nr:hypothetical protein [Chthoniobacteraceae bacterium]